MLEYVIFEKYLTNQHGSWRLHAKIIPAWAEAKAPIIKTYPKPKPIKIDESIENKESKFKDNEDEDNEETNSNEKQLSA